MSNNPKTEVSQCCGVPKEESKTEIRKQINSKIKSLLSSARKETLEEVSKGLCDMFERYESNDPDKSTENWKNYKFIRNNIRDFLSKP